MYFRSISNPLKLFAPAALLALLWTHAAAHSQVASTVSEPAAAYRSAFENYQPHTDEKVISWKEANDNTDRIGGWRAYAKVAEGPPPAQAPQQPAVGPINAPAPKPDPHAGHGKP